MLPNKSLMGKGDPILVLKARGTLVLMVIMRIEQASGWTVPAT